MCFLQDLYPVSLPQPLCFCASTPTPLSCCTLGFRQHCFPESWSFYRFVYILWKGCYLLPLKKTQKTDPVSARLLTQVSHDLTLFKFEPLVDSDQSVMSGAAGAECRGVTGPPSLFQIHRRRRWICSTDSSAFFLPLQSSQCR